jgi:flagellar biosynthesis/type III secretory pathway protein FliH
MSSQQSDSARIAAATAEGYSDGLHDGRQEAKAEVERLRTALRDIKALMPAIETHARGVTERVDAELAASSREEKS